MKLKTVNGYANRFFQKMNDRLPERCVFLIPAVVFLIVIGVQFFTILFLNGGVFTYSLDDAYIHLSLAQNISSGHYGINIGEHSAPSSSIIWPFFISLFAKTLFFEYIPFFVNTVFSFGILAVAGSLCRRFFVSFQPCGRLVTVLFTILLILGGNLTGLVFTGMEHSLQVFVTLLLVSGLISLCCTNRSSWWWVVLVVVAPLVRYEMLALSVPAIWICFRQRETKKAVVSLLCIAGLMVGFSIFLHSLGLGVFPNSVAAKSDIISQSGPLLRIGQNVMSGIFEKRGRGIFLLSMFLGLLTLRFAKKSDRSVRLLSEWVCLAIGLHFCFGQFGWFSRYEIYIWVASVMAMVFLVVRRFGVSLRNAPIWALLLAVTLFFGATSTPYLYAMIMTPIAANNIYEQQYQTHRFITEFYKKPVAVNDIGLPTFENDIYVLDIWGLASKRALDYRIAHAPPVWMDEMAKERNVSLAVIYDTEYKPDGWVHLADWSLSRRRITPSSATVSVFSVNPEFVGEQVSLLQKFKETLPDEVKWVWVWCSDDERLDVPQGFCRAEVEK